MKEMNTDWYGTFLQIRDGIIRILMMTIIGKDVSMTWLGALSF